MRVAADDQVHAPVRVKELCQLAVSLDADVRQQDDHVRVARAVVIADDTNLFGSSFYIDKGADDFFGLCHRQHFFCQNSDEQNFQAADFLLQIRLEEAGVVKRHQQVSVDDREACAFFQEEQMRQPVVHLVIADGADIGRKRIHQVNGGKAAVLRVDH